MDAEQIQQQMKLRRAEIDRKLDLIAEQLGARRAQGGRAIAGALLCAAIVGALWRYRRRAKLRRDSDRSSGALRLVVEPDARRRVI